MGERLTFTFALTGRGEWEHGTQGVALGFGLVGLSARAGPQTRLFPHNLHLLDISILPPLPFTCAAFSVHTIVALLRLVLIAPSALALEIHLQRFQQRAVFRFEFGK